VPTPSQPAAAPLDLVRTNDGGMLRGTIVESLPQQYVVIALPTGETRRIEWANVRYAGPAASAPEAASSAPLSARPPPEPSGVQVRFRSLREGVGFHRVTGTATGTGVGASSRGALLISVRAHSFERLCTAPCELTLEPGEYELALSLPTGSEVVASLVDVRRDGTVTGEYIDRSGLRTAGWATIVLGAVGGLGVMFTPLALIATGDENVDSLSWILTGAGVLTVSCIVGLILGVQGDGAVVRFD
jgi:hypothetical protein